MAWLTKRGSRRNWYIGLWLPHSRKKKFISTRTEDLAAARKILKQIQLTEDLRKTQGVALEALYYDRQQELGLIEGINNRLENDTTLILEGAVEKFLISKTNLVATTTLKTYRLALRDLTGALKPSMRVRDLKRSDFDKILAFLLGRYSPATVNIRLRGMRTFCHWLVEYEYLPKMPFKFRMLKQEQLPKFLTPEGIFAIYCHVTNPVIRSCFKVYEHTGIRLSELFTSELERNYLKVLGKGQKHRFVPIPEAVIDDYLVAQGARYSIHTITRAFTRAWRLSLAEKHPEVVKGRTLHALSNRELKDIIYKVLEMQYAKAHNKPELTEAEKRAAHSHVRTLHSFRHTFALKKWLETRDIFLVRKLLGHSTVTVTEVYTQFPAEYLKTVFEDRAVDTGKGENK